MGKDNVPELQSIWGEAKGYIERGDFDKAIEIYKYIMVRYGDDAVAAEHAHAYLGDIFLTLQQFDMAEDHIKKAIGYRPEKPGYHYILGFVYSHKRRWDKAISEFEIAVTEEPNNGEYLRGLGWAIHQCGDVAKGLAFLEKASRLEPTNANILTDLAIVHLSSLNIDKATECAKRAVRLAPTNPAAQDVLKNVLSFGKGFSQLGERASRAETRPSAYADTHFIHRFKVSLKDRPEIWCIIDIKGNQMLSSLHKAIFKAFDRFEEHQYSFFLSNKPYDRESEYGSPCLDSDGTGKLATRIRIDSIALYGGPRFLYLFDYGDEWWHEVELMSVTERVSRASYPRVVKKQGKSPPQYPRNIET
jgi:tetratricopeptide (TPR) repeat protein